MELSAGRRKRKHSEKFKQELVGECRRPGVSLAFVAMSHEIHPNLLRKWVRDRGGFEVAGVPQVAEPTFVPLTLAAPSVEQTGIRIDLERGETRITVRWPVSAAQDCAIWLRGWLK